MKTPSTLMFRRTHGRCLCLIQPLAATVGLTMVGSAAMAQQQGQLAPITVQASHQVQRKQVGMTDDGIPIEQVKLSRQVGYSDLNLGTRAGAAELEKRIHTTAAEACNQLRTLYPLATWETDNHTCVADAIESAMTQEKSVVTAAQRRQ